MWQIQARATGKETSSSPNVYHCIITSLTCNDCIRKLGKVVRGFELATYQFWRWGVKLLGHSQYSLLNVTKWQRNRKMFLKNSKNLNFNKYFLHFNVRKQNIQRVNLNEQSHFDFTYWILDTTGLNSYFIGSYNNTHFQLYINIFK